MASAPFESSGMELFEPGITKPAPLRIVKRSKTISGRHKPRDIINTGRLSVTPRNPFGSSPEDHFIPLMMHKTRHVRGSLLDGAFDVNSTRNEAVSEVNQNSGQHVLQSERDDVVDATQSSIRAASVGSFLKSELFRESSDVDVTTIVHSTPNLAGSSCSFSSYDDSIIDMATQNSDRKEASVGIVRQTSRSKKLINKAVNSFGSVKSRSMHLLRSKSSKESLARSSSINNHRRDLSISSEASSIQSSISRFSFDPESADIADMRMHQATLVEVAARALLLYPEITVVTECDVIDGGDELTFWSAVLVTGVLQPSEHPLGQQNPQRTIRAGQNSVSSTNGDYGYLENMHIEISAGPDSSLEEVYCEVDGPRNLMFGQTRLCLARFTLGPVIGGRVPHIRQSSQDLFEELENQLNGTIANFMRVAITYGPPASQIPPLHSGSLPGLSYYATSVTTEACLSIRRRTSLPNTSSPLGIIRHLNTNPSRLIPLIETHCGRTRSEELISRITSPSQSLAYLHQRQLGSNRNWNSSSDTIVPRNLPAAAVSQLSMSLEGDRNNSSALAHQHLNTTLADRHQQISADRSALDSETGVGRVSVETDPARKIWSEMRKSSSGSGTKRLGFGVDLQSRSVASEKAESKSLSCNIATRAVEKSNSIIVQPAPNPLNREQLRLKEMAVRNKRSVGADSLRSMAAPSSQMGLGTGKNVWNWGPPWW